MKKGLERIVAGILAGAALLGGAGKSESQEPRGAKIAFMHREEKLNHEIYVINADGSGLTNLTNHPATDECPSWSPDGTKVAFSSRRDKNGEIYVINADGSGLTNLTNHPATDECPSWSPDGTKIMFRSTRGGLIDSHYGSKLSQVYVMNADGSNPINLNLVPISVVDAYPQWSPDGTKIAVSLPRVGAKSFKISSEESDWYTDIYVVNADGSNLTRLTNHPSVNNDLQWSPDGRKIAFVSGRDGNKQIYVIDEDGGNQSRITHNLADNTEPCWSPDGTKVAFFSVSGPDWDWGIYVMNADGSDPTNLANYPKGGTHPRWSPDGKKVIFLHHSAYIYSMNADGSDLVRLTNIKVDDPINRHYFSLSPR
jgi:Tol biopolymer transport system component